MVSSELRKDACQRHREYDVWRINSQQSRHFPQDLLVAVDVSNAAGQLTGSCDAEAMSGLPRKRH